jgi:general stress protein 26
MTKDDQAILEFLKTQPMATISTIAPGSLQPESALIAFTQTDELEIIFETFVDTRKWNNLQQNPHVSLVIGWNTEHYLTVQYEGIAAPAANDEQAEAYIQAFLAKDTPCSEKFLRDKRVRLFKIRPTWVRYSDYTREMPSIIESRYDS